MKSITITFNPILLAAICTAFVVGFLFGFNHRNEDLVFIPASDCNKVIHVGSLETVDRTVEDTYTTNQWDGY